MRAECPFDLQAIDYRGTGPAFGRVQYDHRPARAHRLALRACLLLDLPDLFDGLVERCGHSLVHQTGLVALDEVGRPTATAQELLQFLVADSCEHRRIGNLVAVQMQNWQLSTIA